MYQHLRSMGYFVEVLGSPFTCFDASQYGEQPRAAARAALLSQGGRGAGQGLPVPGGQDQAPESSLCS